MWSLLSQKNRLADLTHWTSVFSADGKAEADLTKGQESTTKYCSSPLGGE